MTSGPAHTCASATTADAVSVEAQLRREQLRIIEKTSTPGLISCAVGSVALLGLALFWTDGVSMRNSLLGIVLCTSVMSGIWLAGLRACRRDDLSTAFSAQFTANMIGTALFFVFVDRGEILGLLTAFVGLSAGAMILKDRAQQRVAWITIAVILTSGVVGETGWVEPIVLPPWVLYTAIGVAVFFGFRTPISAFRMFNDHLRAAREQALGNAQIARGERDRADAQARALADRTEELREFSYVVSHDLRAPLINIEGFSAVLHEAIDEYDADVRRVGPGADAQSLREKWQATHAEVVEALHFIASGTVKMGALISGLLELSRIDSRPAEESVVALAPLVEELVASMQHQIREREVTVIIEPLPEVVGERLRLSQIFGNLLDNAVKYMPQRPPREIRVTCEAQGDEFVFSVADTGDGITPENRQQVFRPFKRLCGVAGAVGDGLGLAAVKRIVERHGGRIWIDDGPAGQGAAFRFTWPSRGNVDASQPTSAAA
jgi:signal transduction histidine kinase